MLIEREIEIERPVDEVFAFLADPRNDPRWCRKVQSVEGAGDRYAVVHKPVPLRPARQMELRVVTRDPPNRLETTQDDGTDRFRVSYELEPTPAGTRVTQRSEAEVGAVPRPLHPLWRHGIGRDVARQLRDLKRLLERD
jgi:carbon monoxide dehydrogenase subunit G